MEHKLYYILLLRKVSASLFTARPYKFWAMVVAETCQVLTLG